MTDRTAAAATRAAVAAAHARELQESFVRGYTMGHLAGFSAAAELAEGALEVGEEHGRESRDPDVDDAYRAGLAAAPEYHTGYRVGLEDAAAVISDLKRRLEAYEPSSRVGGDV